MVGDSKVYGVTRKMMVQGSVPAKENRDFTGAGFRTTCTRGKKLRLDFRAK